MEGGHAMAKLTLTLDTETFGRLLTWIVDAFPENDPRPLRLVNTEHVFQPGQRYTHGAPDDHDD
jgi:hypothetical protein